MSKPKSKPLVRCIGAECAIGCPHRKPHEKWVGLKACTLWGPCTESKKKIRCVKVDEGEDDE